MNKPILVGVGDAVRTWSLENGGREEISIKHPETDASCNFERALARKGHTPPLIWGGGVVPGSDTIRPMAACWSASGSSGRSNRLNANSPRRERLYLVGGAVRQFDL
jgi:hypothetical protein